MAFILCVFVVMIKKENHSIPYNTTMMRMRRVTLSCWMGALLAVVSVVAHAPTTTTHATTTTSIRSRRRRRHDDQDGLKQAASSFSPVEMVVTAHPLATEAGKRILAAGGTVVDAVVAIQTVLGLVEPQSSGLGGGAFCVLYMVGKLTTFE